MGLPVVELRSARVQYQTPIVCPICENAGPFLSSGNKCEVRLLGGELSYVRCARCGGEFQSPMWTQDTMDWWYSSGTYLRAMNGGATPERAEYVAVKRAMFLRAVNINGFPRFLEFGAGEGYLLRAIEKMFGAEVVGIEKDPGRHAAFASTNDPTGEFNVIAAIHSLEHVPHPLDTLRWLMTMLADHGVVLIEVPATGKKYCESHPIAFTQDALAKMTELAGLELIAEAMPGLVGGVFGLYGRGRGEPNWSVFGLSGRMDAEDQGSE